MVSCDNLVDNGVKLARATCAVRRRCTMRELGEWIEREVAFPRTMVDSITPATTDALTASVASTLGVQDRWPVQREAFTQWVIEDVFRHTVPDWERMGVTLTNDVAGYDRAKLRLLNGAHSTLAYVGLLAGYATVAEAMKDETLRTFVQNLMTEDILPSLTAPRGLDLRAYIDSILERFRNPAMRSRAGADRVGRLAETAVPPARHDSRSAGLAAADRPAVRADRGVDAVRAARGAARRAVKDPLAPQLLDIGARMRRPRCEPTCRASSRSSRCFPPSLRIGRALLDAR